MDCNKDEALKAKELAEKKLLNNDFEGAKKVAVKAERLYPQLENISQLLAVCNVHCSSQNKVVGSERDWYGILQIDKFSDESTIKKQYRRLALVLHPDKNKLPGAEAAFKLIVEANMVLSDPVKRSSYDNKCKVLSKSFVAKQPPHQVNRYPFVRQNNINNGFNAPFNTLNNRQSTQPASSTVQETFWTECPSCKVRYQYYSNYVNSALRCQKCSKPFIAFDIGSQGVPPGPKWSQPAFQDVPLKSNRNQSFVQKELPNQGTSKMTAGSAGFPPTRTGPQQGPEICRGKTAPVFEDMRTKRKDEKRTGGMREGAAMPKVDRKSRKRGRKQTVESSESSDTSTSVETEDVEFENGNNPPAGQGTGLDAYGSRRSSRRRQNVSYNEGVSDDENDLASPLKKARSNQSAGDSKPLQKEAVGGDNQRHACATRPCSNSVERLNQNGVGCPERDVQTNNFKIATVNGQASGPPSGGAKNIELLVDSDSEPDTISDSNPAQVYDYPDPEFSDFDKHKAENRFAIDQIWACYDTDDGMPRFYAHIRKVSSPEFNVIFSWLEAHPEDQGGRAWVRAELPVGCGKFKRGCTDSTSDRLTFSHQVPCEMGKRGLYVVYPRKGETWALFKDWDICWTSDPKNHRKYKYEIVEILSDYVGDVGVQVGYLDKVTGFVSLFQRTRITVSATFFVKPNELYKFSHRVPSFKMTGTEREGVPAGSFELDPASLPLDPDDIWYPGKVKEESRTSNSQPIEEVLFAVPPGTRDKSRTSENATISLKSGDLKGIHATDGESAKIRKSARGVNNSEKKQNKMSSLSANDNPSTDFDDNCVKKNCHSSPSIPSHLSCQADEVLHSPTKSFGLGNSSGSSKNPITLSDEKGSEEVFCDFRMDRSMGKFQVDQVWALYGQNSTLPKTYAQIKKIVPSPFKLHVVLLESSAGRKNAPQTVCGTFKVQNEKCQVVEPSTFSHVVKTVSNNRNRFETAPSFLISSFLPPLENTPISSRNPRNYQNLTGKMINFRPPETRTRSSAGASSSVVTAEKALSFISKGWQEVRSSADADLQLIKNRANSFKNLADRELENFINSASKSPFPVSTITASATTIPAEIDFVKKLRPKLSEIRRAYSSPEFKWPTQGKLRIDLSAIKNVIVAEVEEEEEDERERWRKWRRERFKEEGQFGEFNWEPIKAFKTRLRELEVDLKGGSSSSPVDIFEGIKNSEFVVKVKSSLKSICKEPEDTKGVPPLDVPELLAYLVRQSSPFLDQIGIRRDISEKIVDSICSKGRSKLLLHSLPEEGSSLTEGEIMNDELDLRIASVLQSTGHCYEGGFWGDSTKQNLSGDKRHVAIVTTASLPWMTGTAVNPLFRAAYLAKSEKQNVTLLVPWLCKSDQELVYPNQLTFSSPEDQVLYIRNWLEERIGFKANFKISFYPGKFSKERRSIMPAGDTSQFIPSRDADIAILEEPEHLNWYHHGKRWTDKFNHVVGIVHTNYLEYIKREKNGALQAFFVKHVNNLVTRAYCDKVLRLSAATQDLPKSLVCNVHGVNPKFLKIGEKAAADRQSGQQVFSKGAYFLGKMVWAKGYRELIDLLANHKTDLDGFNLDVYGNGEDAHEVQSTAKRLNLNVNFMKGRDHADDSLHGYKVFINPSISDVLCTATAEALAMGKFVVCADHPSNEFFQAFPNCLTYRTPDDFVAKVQEAMSSEPQPLTPEEQYKLSWEAATQRFMEYSDLDKVLASETSLDRRRQKVIGKSVSLPNLEEMVDGGLAFTHNCFTGNEFLRLCTGAIPRSRDYDKEHCKDLHLLPPQVENPIYGW